MTDTERLLMASIDLIERDWQIDKLKKLIATLKEEIALYQAFAKLSTARDQARRRACPTCQMN